MKLSTFEHVGVIPRSLYKENESVKSTFEKFESDSMGIRVTSHEDVENGLLLGAKMKRKQMSMDDYLRCYETSLLTKDEEMASWCIRHVNEFSRLFDSILYVLLLCTVPDIRQTYALVSLRSLFETCKMAQDPTLYVLRATRIAMLMPKERKVLYNMCRLLFEHPLDPPLQKPNKRREWSEWLDLGHLNSDARDACTKKYKKAKLCLDMNQCVEVGELDNFQKRSTGEEHTVYFEEGISDEECQKPPLYIVNDHTPYHIKKFFEIEDQVSFKDALEQFAVILSIVDGLSQVEIEDEHHDEVLQSAWKNMNHLVCIMFDRERQAEFQSSYHTFGGAELLVDMIRDIRKNPIKDSSQYGMFLKRFLKEKFSDNWNHVLNSHNSWHKSPTSLLWSFLMSYADNGTVQGRVAVAHIAELVEWVLLGKIDEALACWTAIRYILYPPYVQKEEDVVKVTTEEKMGGKEEESRSDNWVDEDDSLLAALNFRQVPQTKEQVVTRDHASLEGNWMEQILAAGLYPERNITSIRGFSFQESIDNMNLMETFHPVIEQWMLDSTCPTLLLDYFENPSKNEFCSGPNMLFADLEEEHETFSVDQLELKKKVRRYSRVLLQGIQGTDVDTLTFLDTITLAAQNFRRVIQSLGKITGKRYSVPVHSLLWYTGNIRPLEKGDELTLYKSKAIHNLTKREDNKLFTWKYNFKNDADGIFEELPFYDSKGWNSRMEKLEKELTASGAGADVEFIEAKEAELLSKGKPEPIKDESIPQLEESNATPTSPSKRKRRQTPPPKPKKRYCSPGMRPSDKGTFGNSIKYIAELPIATTNTRKVSGCPAKRLSHRVNVTPIYGSSDTGLVWIGNRLYLSYEVPDDDDFIPYLTTVWAVKKVASHICVLNEDGRWKIFFFGEANINLFNDMRGERVRCKGDNNWLTKKRFSSAQMAAILYPHFVLEKPMAERRLFMSGDDVFITNGRLRRNSKMVLGDTAKVERFAKKQKKYIQQWKDYFDS